MTDAADCFECEIRTEFLNIISTSCGFRGIMENTVSSSGVGGPAPGIPCFRVLYCTEQARDLPVIPSKAAMYKVSKIFKIVINSVFGRAGIPNPKKN
jgi:hypothetical protein